MSIEKDCPFNCEDGQIFHMGLNKLQTCPICSGYGTVDETEVCACGKPCLMRKEGFAYCGRDLCFADKRRESYSRELPTNSFHRGWPADWPDDERGFHGA